MILSNCCIYHIDVKTIVLHAYGKYTKFLRTGLQVITVCYWLVKPWIYLKKKKKKKILFSIHPHTFARQDFYHCLQMSLEKFSLLKNILDLHNETRRSENDDTPQPLDQWTNSPFIGQQAGNWSICHALWPIRKPIVHPTLYPTHISFIPSQSNFPFLKYGY